MLPVGGTVCSAGRMRAQCETQSHKEQEGECSRAEDSSTAITCDGKFSFLCVCGNRKLHTHLLGYGHQAPGINAVFKYNRERESLFSLGINAKQKRKCQEE